MSNTKKPKLTRLPKNAKITKRPLMRPAIPSPYAGAQSQKVVYVSKRTPFMSAVKRVQKLLHLCDKRLVQSATTIAQDRQYRKRRRGGGDGDDIEAIAEVAEEQKRNHKRRKTGSEEESAAGEEVVLKGTGKAIPRVMELGVFFQQREEEYSVRLATGTTSSIDDVEYEKEVDSKDDAQGGAEKDGVEVDEPGGTDVPTGETGQKEYVSEARIRKVNVLEVHVSLR